MEGPCSLTTLISLRDQCLLYLVGHLEEIPIRMLGLLPRAIRYELLLNLPSVDVHKLEKTQVANDIDMEEIWREIYWSRCSSNTEEFCSIIQAIVSSLQLCLSWKTLFQMYIVHITTFQQISSYYTSVYPLQCCYSNRQSKILSLLQSTYNSTLFPRYKFSGNTVSECPTSLSNILGCNGQRIFTGICFNITASCGYCCQYIPMRHLDCHKMIQCHRLDFLYALHCLLYYFNFRSPILLLNINIGNNCIDFKPASKPELLLLRNSLSSVLYMQLENWPHLTSSHIDLLEFILSIISANGSLKTIDLSVVSSKYIKNPALITIFVETVAQVITNQCCELREFHIRLPNSTNTFTDIIISITEKHPHLKSLKVFGREHPTMSPPI